MNKLENTLNLKLKLYQKTVLNFMRSFDWDNETSPTPLVVELDPTTACNLACPDCISRDLLNQGLFSRKRIKELVSEFVDAGVKAVVLIGGGEPLLHPEIRYVIEFLGKNNIQIGITTNGIILDKYSDIISEYASWVRVSVDAGSSEIYQKIRPSITGKSEFWRVIDNMKNFANIKKQKLGYSFMIYSSGLFDKNEDAPMQMMLKPTKNEEFVTNVDEIFIAAKLAKEIGCDYFELKPMYDKNHFLILQDKELIQKARELSEKAKELEDENFKVLFATKLKDLFNGEQSIEPKFYTRCAVAQLRTLVTPSGVYVCPYFRGRKDMKLGDVTNTPFLEMWHGKKRKEVLSHLNPSIHCLMHCIRHESNLIIEDILKGKLHPTPVEDFDLFI